IPFLVLRTIADSATRELPPAALIPLLQDGTPSLTRVFGEVLRRPRQIAALWGLARETRRALVALARPAHAVRGVFFAAYPRSRLFDMARQNLLRRELPVEHD